MAKSRVEQQLEELDLSNTHVDDAAMVNLRPLKELRKLDLTVARITDKGLVRVPEMTIVPLFEASNELSG